MDDVRTSHLLKRHEGLRLRPYRDTVGKLTIGYGRNLDDRGLSVVESELLLANDIVDVADTLRRLLPWFDRLDDVRQAVLVDMAVNLGVAGLLRFRRTLASIEAGDYDTAADQMLDSRWAGQVGTRAVELAEMMRSGAWGSRDAWFPRLSPSGRRLATGSVNLTIDNILVVDGASPQWADEETVVYRRHSDGALVRWPGGAVLDARGGNEHSARGPYWAVYHAGTVTTRWSHGPEQPGVSSPAVNASGDRAWLDQATGRLFVAGRLLDDRACLEPRWTGRLLVYVADNRTDVCAYDLSTGAHWRRGRPHGSLSVESQEFWPHVVEARDGMRWLVTHGHARLLVRPLGTIEGYAVRRETYFPDAAFLDDRRLRVVASTGAGELVDFTLDTTAPRIDLRPDVEPPSPPPPPPPEDDMHSPGVTIEHYDRVLRNGQPWRMRTLDRNNPGVIVETEFVPAGPDRWSVHQRLVNPAGADRSGVQRIVEHR